MSELEAETHQIRLDADDLEDLLLEFEAWDMLSDEDLIAFEEQLTYLLRGEQHGFTIISDVTGQDA